MNAPSHLIKRLPSKEVLRVLFDYNPDSGKLFWRTRPRDMFSTDRAQAAWNAKNAGREAFRGETRMAEGTVAADQLRLFIERIERLEEEKKGIAGDVSDVYSEAKANGYDTKTMRAIVKLRKLETHVRDEQDALIETYRAALGMPFVSTPLGQYADHLKDMDKQGIGVSMQVGDGGFVPLNETAQRAN